MTEILPLLVFTVFSGLSAGAYVASAMFFKNKEEGGRPWRLPFIGLVLLGIGLLGTLAHLGHPERFINGMANPGAMVSQEAYWSMAFGALMLVDLVVALAKKRSIKAIRIVGAIFAVGLMVVTSLAYYLAFGNEAWFNWTTIPFFVFGDLAMGFALYGMLAKDAIAHSVLVKAHLAIEALFALSIIGIAVCFASISVPGLAMYIAALILGPIGAIGFLFFDKAKPDFIRVAPAHILACAVIGAILSRYAFYAVNVF